MFAFKLEVRTKKSACKNKTIQYRQAVFHLIKCMFKVLSTGTKTCPQPWLPCTDQSPAWSMTRLKSAHTELTAASDCRRLGVFFIFQ